MILFLLWLICGYLGYKLFGVNNIFFEAICIIFGPITFLFLIGFKIYKISEKMKRKSKIKDIKAFLETKKKAEEILKNNPVEQSPQLSKEEVEQLIKYRKENK